MVDVGGNCRNVLNRIAEAALRVGRDPREIRLLAAAKSQSVAAMRTAVAAGVTLIGENYVQEAADKRKDISDSVEWHMIGHLQRNKVKLAVALFDVIETLDNLALARELDKEGVRRGKPIRAFVEVNLGAEENKSGIAKQQVSGLFQELAKLSHLRVDGLMTVAPFRPDLEAVRPYFRELRELRDQVNELGMANVRLTELSMGMTHDFTVAIEEGATIVRVGTALFGPRSN
jgi:PLP dependent protein